MCSRYVCFSVIIVILFEISKLIVILIFLATSNIKGSQLVLCIRKSMKVYDKPTSWTKEFSGYLISLLVIFYFQVTKRLPSVWSLQKDFPENPGNTNTIFFGILEMIPALNNNFQIPMKDLIHPEMLCPARIP